MTAIDWLESQLINIDEKQKEKFITAKLMERQQIIDAWNSGDYSYFYSSKTKKDFLDGNEYYNEIYNNQNKTK